MSARFWPGYDWRVLAHERSAPGRKGAYTGQRITLSSKDHDTPVEFDELVIDHWFHLEQMADRHWWVSVGGWHINVSIDAAGKPLVSMEQAQTPEEVQSYRAAVVAARRKEPS